MLLVSSPGYAQRPTHSYVFVGEKIDVHRITIPPQPNTIMMDEAFEATYRVVHEVYGDYAQDIILFRVYDHYGTPGFAKFQRVLLYVSEYEGKLYHEKYQFSPVFLASNGRWAGPYATGDYQHPYLEKAPTRVKPEKILFGPDAFIDITGYASEMARKQFPEPYYRLEGNRAIPVLGNYVEDLFQLKKEGVFKARGLF
ncbi:MAG: hypothetical protein EOO56_18080 [Hymenobacter sp.]|nr:MAG: hypothetical protein EOO56_18080 [Hymenobacter sp.]